MQRSLPKKALFSSFSAHLTQKTMTWVYKVLMEKDFTATRHPISCSIRWNSSHAENMHSHMILHGRLPGISKEGQMLLLSMIVKTCVISLISNHVKHLINNHH